MTDFDTLTFFTKNSHISPYLLMPLRTLEEAKAEIAARKANPANVTPFAPMVSSADVPTPTPTSNSKSGLAA